MKKIDLITTLAQKTGLNKVDVLVALESFFEEVEEQLVKGETVVIRGFGNFTTKTRAPKVARHINKNEPIHLPETKVPVFKPAQALTEAVKTGQKSRKKRQITVASI